ncbi:MAG: helix-turn-helix domain-containing protein [Melioribacteraceae bacterium]|nr:MAG: helix-turn-helix domain-containing protein [Melioribacteraceae bacterium]
MGKVNSKYYTVRDFANHKGLSRQTIYNWIQNNKLEVNRDYIRLSDGSIAIIMNERTKSM